MSTFDAGILMVYGDDSDDFTEEGEDWTYAELQQQVEQLQKKVKELQEKEIQENKVKEELENKIKELHQQVRRLEEYGDDVQAWQHGMVELNVGGTPYQASVETLRRQTGSGSMLRAMFNGNMLPGAQYDGTAIFLDRDGGLFQYILAYLRSYKNSVFDVNIVKQACTHLNIHQVYQLKREFDFFGIDVCMPGEEEGENVNLFDFYIRQRKPVETKRVHVGGEEYFVPVGFGKWLFEELQKPL